MKKILMILPLLCMLLCTLIGCSLPSPAIKTGEFDFSVTYEHDGELKTLSGVYACKYEGTARTIDSSIYRVWEGHFKDGTLSEVVPICTTEDGGKIELVFLIYPEYFMGEPDYVIDFAPVARMSLSYYDSDNMCTEICEDAEVIAGYGVKLISFEYAQPIENTFG